MGNETEFHECKNADRSIFNTADKNKETFYNHDHFDTCLHEMRTTIMMKIISILLQW